MDNCISGEHISNSARREECIQVSGKFGGKHQNPLFGCCGDNLERYNSLPQKIRQDAAVVPAPVRVRLNISISCTAAALCVPWCCHMRAITDLLGVKTSEIIFGNVYPLGRNLKDFVVENCGTTCPFRAWSTPEKSEQGIYLRGIPTSYCCSRVQNWGIASGTTNGQGGVSMRDDIYFDGKVPAHDQRQILNVIFLEFQILL